MCDTGKLREKLFASIPRLKAGQCVYVIASKPSAKDEIKIQAILYCATSDAPQEALDDFCKALGLEAANHLCLPVVLPEAMRQEDVKGFKAVRNGTGSLYIVFTS